MGITSNLRKQHKELAELSAQMTEQFVPDTLSRDARHVYGMFLALADSLKFHLKREDEALYPALMRHPDKKVSALAKKYIEEMGGINKSFADYASRWPHEMAIQDNPDGFIEETKAIFKALSERIDKEDNELYPLLEIR